MRWLITLVGVGCSYSPERTTTEPPGSDAPIVETDAPVLPACATNPLYTAGGPQEGHGYRVLDPIDYESGVEQCALDGAHAVVIESADENAFLTTLLAGAEAWIGFDDLTTEGTFRWITGAQPLYRNFVGGEPNDATAGEDCAHLRGDGKWNDSDCDNAGRRLICECEPGYQAPAVRACRAMAGAFVHKGRKYFIQQTAAGWVEAQAFCESIDAYLAVPSDDTENTMLDQRFIDTSWIGYSDRATEGTFEWVDGSPTGYLHFQTGEPSNGTNQNCVAMAFAGARWDDTDCVIQRPYACECPPLH